jgi:hypothetical protein
MQLMKKLFTLLFTAALAFSLAMPVFAQDTGSQEAPKSEKKSKKTKATKEKKTKEKKTKEGQ